jgi:hypothetical protein
MKKKKLKIIQVGKRNPEVDYFMNGTKPTVVEEEKDVDIEIHKNARGRALATATGVPVPRPAGQILPLQG